MTTTASTRPAPAATDDWRLLFRLLLLPVALCGAVLAGWLWHASSTSVPASPPWLGMRELRTQLVDGGHVSVKLTLQPAARAELSRVRALMPALEAAAVGVVGGSTAKGLRGAAGVARLQDALHDEFDEVLVRRQAAPLDAVLVEQLVVATEGPLPLN
jgi:flagellar basal body-associated protein FliL